MNHSTLPTRQRLLLLGATGAVGEKVLELALADPRVHTVLAPTRRPLAKHDKLKNPVTDFSQVDPQAEWLAADCIICALGTTIKAAGSRRAFAYVDLMLPVRIATLSHARGAKVFALVSSLGASVNGNFYLRTKAQTEEAIAAIPFDSCTIVRPSLIDAKRQTERTGEKVGNAIASIFRPLVPMRYRPVKPEQIAQTLLEAALDGSPGWHVIESDQLHAV